MANSRSREGVLVAALVAAALQVSPPPAPDLGPAPQLRWMIFAPLRDVDVTGSVGTAPKTRCSCWPGTLNQA